MRQKVWKELKRQWGEAMKKNLPEWQPHTEEPLPRTCRAWRRRDRGMTFFIMLLAHSKEDIFTIELSWSEHGYRNPDPERQRKPAESVRLPSLSNPSRIERWWEIVPRKSLQELHDWLAQGGFLLPEESADICLPKIPGLVEEAMGQLLAHGLPLFETKSAH